MSVDLLVEIKIFFFHLMPNSNTIDLKSHELLTKN